MQKEFIKYLRDVCGVSGSKRFLLAVSGGIDSMVMLKLFHLSGFDFALAHCNFHLRGAESDGDQQFVESVADETGKPCHVKDFDTLTYMLERGVSLQMAARDLRYAWFDELAGKHGYDYIVTGHNQNDAIETVLLNFSRGTGIRGLTGINPRHGKVIRPLLFASRNLILQFARDNNLIWREDSSNAEQKYYRNKIRHTIIPAFESINPAFMPNALETIVRLGQTEKLLDLFIQQVKHAVWTELSDRVVLDINKLTEFPAVELLLYELLKDYGINPLTVKSIFDSFSSISGKQFHTRTHCITRDRTGLIITPKISPVEAEVLIEAETASVSYPINLEFTTFEIRRNYEIPAERSMAAIDADKIRYPLKLRCWKAGDKFHPLGMSGSKKISDFLINNKIALPDKQHIWILETAGNIAWVVNFRIDDRFRITADTRKILLVKYIE